MDLTINQPIQKIAFSFCIIIFYLVSIIILSNVIIAFVLSINILYFSREIFYDKLFPISTSNDTSNLKSNPFPLLQSESDNLPENIKKILLASTFQADSTIVDSKNNVLISAIQKAESLIDDKIKQLQSKRIVTKKEIISFQNDIKSELVKELPEIQRVEDDWIDWSPLVLHNKINQLEIYCEKCENNFQVQDTIYEITKEPDHFKITAVHQSEDEQHINTIKITPESFEILSKPILEIKQSKEVEA